MQFEHKELDQFQGKLPIQKILPRKGRPINDQQWSGHRERALMPLHQNPWVSLNSQCTFKRHSQSPNRTKPLSTHGFIERGAGIVWR